MVRTKKGIIRNLYFSEKVIEAMSQIFNYPITIVEAPMGYGKTTAVREQLNIYNANVAWQRVYDNSLSNFWNGFCILFSKFNKILSQRLLQLQFPNESVSLSTALEIIEQIEIPKNSVIVIDDYHLVECDETNAFIEFLVMNEITNLNIVLTTRYTYFSKLEELKLKGYLYHIEKEVFELVPKEIMQYYKQCGISIKDNEAEELYNFTEGWISALYLIMLDYESNENYLHTHDIYTLIDKVIYKPLKTECKDFFVTMCIFDNFTLKQAAYMWESENFKEFIDELVYKNAFVTFDYNKKIYHIHSLFKKFLIEMLDSKKKCYKDELYKKAAYWYMENREYISSMRYAYLAGDFDILLKVFELDKGYSINSEYKDLIIKYFEECPKKIKQKFPLSIIIFARRMFTFNEVALCRKACNEFMDIIQNMNNIDDEYKTRLLGEYELLLSFTVYNDIEKMLKHYKRSYELLNGASCILDNNAAWTFGSPSVLYMFYRTTGKLEKDVQIIKKYIYFYINLTNGNGKGAEYVIEAERYYYMGDFQNSQIVVHKALKAANDDFKSGIIICSIFLQIKLYLIKGEFSNILNLLKKMREDINVNKGYVFMHTLDMCEAYIYSCLGINEHIQSWIRNGEFKNTRLFFPTMGFLNIVFGRVLLINGEYLKLIGNSESFTEMASIFPNLLAQIYTYIYISAANNQIFRNNEAFEALEKALAIAMPDKMYMPFVENCDYIKCLLEQIKQQGIFSEDITNILEMYKHYEKAVKQIKKEYYSESKPTLTEREFEIAKLAGEGLSNKEIGEKLFISLNTVKTQLKSVFDKLNINSRALLKQYFDSQINIMKKS